ncbi:MAG: hypothetical protein K6F96_01270 [Bacteroidales bacterium]|nr:hypothetical protein [Bacteroidales bacterium]
MNKKQTLFQSLSAILLFFGIALGQTAFAQTDWEVTRDINGNIATFQIKHVGSYSNQTKVRYRTVNLSAYEGQHRLCLGGLQRDCQGDGHTHTEHQ